MSHCYVMLFGVFIVPNSFYSVMFRMQSTVMPSIVSDLTCLVSQDQLHLKLVFTSGMNCVAFMFKIGTVLSTCSCKAMRSHGLRQRNPTLKISS